jgi:hypothetical protein
MSVVVEQTIADRHLLAARDESLQKRFGDRRCSRIRLVDVHHWPALEKPAVTAASSVASRSASAMTISAFLPPSSSCVARQIRRGLRLNLLSDRRRASERNRASRGSSTMRLPINELEDPSRS